MSRALNLARRYLNREQQRQLIRDQLSETPEKTNRVVAKILGVHHVTVASVRGEMESVGQIIQQDRRVGGDGKTYKSAKASKTVRSADENARPRPDAVTLIHGDCRNELGTFSTTSRWTTLPFLGTMRGTARPRPVQTKVMCGRR